MGQHLTITTRNSDLKHENSNAFSSDPESFSWSCEGTQFLP